MTEQELLQLAKKAGFDFQGKGNTQWTRPYEYCELAFYRFADYVSEHLSAALAAAQEREAKLVEALEEIVSARTVTASPQQLAHELQRIASAVLSQSSHEQARQAEVPSGKPWEPVGALGKVNHPDRLHSGHRIIGWRIKDEGTMHEQLARLDAAPSGWDMYDGAPTQGEPSDIDTFNGILDACAANHINIQPDQMDKPNRLLASRLVAMAMLSHLPLHTFDVPLRRLGWVAGLRGKYWLLYVNPAENNSAYTNAYVGHWRSTHEVPAGWKLVPTEPTDEMLEASPHGWKYDEIAEVYRAMIAAAPSGKEEQ